MWVPFPNIAILRVHHTFYFYIALRNNMEVCHLYCHMIYFQSLSFF